MSILKKRLARYIDFREVIRVAVTLDDYGFFSMMGGLGGHVLKMH